MKIKYFSNINWNGATDDECFQYYSKYAQKQVEVSISDKRNNVCTELKKVFYLWYGNQEVKQTVCIDVFQLAFESTEF